MNEIEFSYIVNSKIHKAESFRKDRKIWIYGAGKGGEILFSSYHNRDLNIEGFVDIRSDEIGTFCGKQVVSLNTINPIEDYVVISLMRYDRSVIFALKERGYDQEDFYYFVCGEGFNTQSIVYEGCKIGKYTYGYESFLEKTLFMGESFVKEIGAFSSINSTARVYGNHIEGAVSSHSFMFDPKWHQWENAKEVSAYSREYEARVGEERYSPVFIGNDVWIGANAIILPGVKVGNGAVIGSGAVVTKDVKAYSVCGGVPAKHIHFRFSEDICKKMERIEWWNWENDLIFERMKYFYNPEEFIDRFS